MGGDYGRNLKKKFIKMNLILVCSAVAAADRSSRKKGKKLY